MAAGGVDGVLRVHIDLRGGCRTVALKGVITRWCAALLGGSMIVLRRHPSEIAGRFQIGHGYVDGRSMEERRNVIDCPWNRPDLCLLTASPKHRSRANTEKSRNLSQDPLQPI